MEGFSRWSFVIQGFQEESAVILDQLWLTDEQFSKIKPHLFAAGAN